jgi:hypothetical protein
MRCQFVVVALCLFLFLGSAAAQPIDRSNAPDCSAADVAQLAETVARYQGIRGINPAAPSTYDLIGNHKFSGTILSASNIAFGENWYPIRTEKQTLTGTLHAFGVSNYGDESDWNIHILPDAGFEDFVADAIPYRSDNPLISTFINTDWATTSDGRILIEAEITPDEHRYGNQWFDNREKFSPLLNRRLTAYGPFVREEAHGNQPEIHPAEQIWWRDGADAMVILLVVDDSNRFNDGGDYATRRVTTPAFIPWTQEKAQRAELSLAFELDPARAGLYMSVQSLDDLNFLRDASFPDAAANNPILNSYRGNTILAVDQAAAINPFVGVTFRDICVNRAKGTLQGYVVLNTAIGNGGGREGFVALRVDRREIGFDSGPALLTGDLLNTWKVFTPYDNRVSPADIISSDMRGTGIVDGLIDFNGNGKTDLFAKVGDAWMVLFDGRGTWQEINTSSTPKSELRFGDIDGDGKTDVLRVGPNNKVQVSFGGTGEWTGITDAGEQNPVIKVGDFNGDGKTDIVYLKLKASFPPTQPLTFRADMFVKFSARGEWKKLNNDYVIRDFDEYLAMFRFGDFNGDGITDIFRFRNGSFNVYFSGTGDIQELHTPSFAVDVDDLLFVPDLTMMGLTDVIHVDRTSKKWTVFPGGKPGTLPLTIRFGDPAVVRFGDLDADPAVEPFAIDFVPQRRSPADVAMTPVTKAISEPVAYTRYVPGSVKRVRQGDRSFLTVSLNLQRSSGNRPKNRKGDDLRSVSRARAGQKNLQFKRAALAQPSQAELLGTIENVPLDPTEENLLQVAFAPAAPPSSFELPAHGITAVYNAVIMQPGTVEVSWTRWQALLTSTANSLKSKLLASPPAPPTRIDSVAFELAPLYSSREGGKVRLAEMDDVAKELNEIAYGSNRERASAIFGNRAPFAITWQFELKNMNTGELLPIEDSASLASQGKWPASNVRFAFPGSDDLLRFTATARITDDLGNGSIEPISRVFWNQQIALAAPDEQLAEWLKQLPLGVDEARLLVKARYLAEDGVLSPAEVGSILR